MLANPLAKLVLIGLAWAYLHHFCAGIRYLLLDLHIGIELKPARQSSVIVLAVGVALTLIVAVPGCGDATASSSARTTAGATGWCSAITAVVMALYTLLMLGIVL